MAEPKAHNKALADPLILDKIDKLFACGVGDLVDLPQLVVVGDQSSGKSSVLEGLTKLSFPRDSGLCTRFATQITFRRSEHMRAAASILAATNASAEHRKHVELWSAADLGSEGLDAANLGKIIMDAQKCMGLSTSEEEASSKTFSNDVLRIDIEGPDQEHLSIVDVPGIFRNADDGRTTKEDIYMVEEMVASYMKNPRTVMLAVVSANIDIATQGILQMAKQYDPEGLRTVGVLTKPDLVDRGGESKVIDLVNNRRYRLQLGWHLVRNPGQAAMEDASFDRDAEEKAFFARQAPWNTIDFRRCGIEPLRTNIVDILARHVRREFPKVRKDIAARLDRAEKRFRALGERRSTPGEQRLFLTGISSEFERLMQDALQTRYNVPLFDEQKLRLPTILMTRQEKYSQAMMRFGHEYAFERKPNSGEAETNNNREANHTLDFAQGFSRYSGSAANIPNIPPTEEHVDDESDVEMEETMPATEAAEKHHAPADSRSQVGRGKTGPMRVRDGPSSPELSECTIGESTTVSLQLKSGIIAWLTNQHSLSRGFELGGIDSTIVHTVFRGQSCKWQALTQGYISDSIEAVHGFIKTLLQMVIPDARVFEVLMSRLMDDLLKQYKVAFDHTLFLLQVEQECVPMTANHYFNDNLQKARKKRVRDEADRLSFKYQAFGDQPTRKAVYVDVLSNATPMSNKEHVIADLHDVLKSYYKVAIKRFVDNVIQQSVLYHLVDSADSPLKVFSAKYVSGLADEELANIAGEDPLVKAERDGLKNEIDKLMQGRKIL